MRRYVVIRPLNNETATQASTASTQPTQSGVPKVCGTMIAMTLPSDTCTPTEKSTTPLIISKPCDIVMRISGVFFAMIVLMLLT